MESKFIVAWCYFVRLFKNEETVGELSGELLHELLVSEYFS